MRTFGWILGFAALAGYVAGCNSQDAGTPYSETEQNAADDEHAGEHEHEHGAHGGHIIELTDDHSVHGEFVVDNAAKMVKLYLTGSDLKAPVEATAVQFHAEPAEGQSGEGAEIEMTAVGGKTPASEFEAPLDKFPSTDIEKLHGHVHVTVGDKELSGDLSHDHDHEHEHAGETK